ncbi:MAG: hypothetical protein RL180_39, partial [Pseudomonadota bacterium]
VTLAVLNGKKDRVPVPTTVQYLDLQLSDEFAFGKMWRKRSLTPAEQQRLTAFIHPLNADLIVTGYNNGHWLGDYLQGNVWHWIHGELIEQRATPHLFKAIKEWIRRLRHRHAFKRLFNGRQLIVVNQDLAHHYQTLLPNAPIHVIANGVDQHRLRAALTQAQPEKRWDVLFLGRLVTIKQADHALIAFADSGLTGRMAIAGDGPERERLVQQAHALGIADRVDFLGWVSQPADLIAQSRTLILSSRSEGSPMAIVEALSLGTPVVAYNCCRGITDAFPTQVAMQALVEPQNQQQLAQTLAQVVQHPYVLTPDERANLSIERMAQRFLALI